MAVDDVGGAGDLNLYLKYEHLRELMLSNFTRTLKEIHFVQLYTLFSRYFNSILRSNAAPHPIIFMRDVKFVEMKTILDFIYKGEAYVAQENIQGVLKTADALKVTGKSLQAKMYKVIQ
jgi:hypothetical protein